MWCSDRCRKTQYSSPCVDCGKALNGSDGPNARLRCVACAAARASDDSGRAARALEMWRLREVEGLLNREIAARLNVPATTVAAEMCRLRALGFAVPKAAYRGADRRSTEATFTSAENEALRRSLERLGVYPPDTGLPWRTQHTITEARQRGIPVEVHLACPTASAHASAATGA